MVARLSSPALGRTVAAALVLCFLSTSGIAKQQRGGVFEAVPLLKEREREMMANAHEYEEHFLRRGYRYHSPELEGLVQRIGKEVSPEPTDPYIDYRFFLIEGPFPNAFALPDGQVYVTTGMMAILENEAQLAALLGHEVTHTAGHHAILTYRSTRKKLITSVVMLGVADIFVTMSILGYSRDLEEEADAVGFETMLDRRYDPREMVHLWELMNQDIEGEKPDVSTKWSTHPDIEVRIAATRERIEVVEIDLDLLRRGDERFRTMTRDVAVQTVGEFIGRDYPRHAVDLAERLADRPDADGEVFCALGDALRALGARTKEPADLAKREKRELRKDRYKLTQEERKAARRSTPEGQEVLHVNLEASRLAYERALELDPDLAQAHRGLGYTFEELHRDLDAGKEFVKYLRLAPDAADKPIVLRHRQDITERVKPEEAP